MATGNFHDRAMERDNNLVRGLCHTLEGNVVRDLRDWIEEELKELIIEAQLQQEITDGLMRDQFKSAEERLQLISRSDLRDALQDCNDAIHNSREGFWGDVYAAYDPMIQAVTKLVQIVRAMLELRVLIAPTPDN